MLRNLGENRAISFQSLWGAGDLTSYETQSSAFVDYLCANSSLFPEYSTATWPDRSPRTDVTNTLNYQFSTGNTAISYRPTYSRNILNRIP